MNFILSDALYARRLKASNLESSAIAKHSSARIRACQGQWWPSSCEASFSCSRCCSIARMASTHLVGSMHPAALGPEPAILSENDC